MNQTQVQEQENARHSAVMAVLGRIEQDVKDGMLGEHISGLAEAYAWLTSPAQPHGGGAVRGA